MIVITQKAGTLGTFKTVEKKEDRLLCDDRIEFPFAVIGTYEISEDDSLMPQPMPHVEVPKSVTRRQAIQQLIIEDLDDDVDAIINAIPDLKQRKLMRAWYAESQVFERDRPELNQVWAMLGKTQSQLDTTFINAAKR